MNRLPFPSPPQARRGIHLKASDLTIIGILGAVSATLGLVPGLGFIPAPTPAGAATTMHLPAILAGIARGPLAGALVGAIFGFFSFTRATLPFFKDPLIAFGPRILIGVFASVAFAFFGRRTARAVVAVVCGASAYAILGPGARAFEAALAAGRIRPNALVDAYHLVAATGSAHPWITPLVGVLVAGLCYVVLRGDDAPAAAAAVVGSLTNTIGVLTLIVLRFPQMMPPGAAMLVAATHGLPEALLAVVVTVPVHRALRAARLV